MGKEFRDPVVAMAHCLDADPAATTVSSFVVEARRRGVDPLQLLDADFFFRGTD